MYESNLSLPSSNYMSKTTDISFLFFLPHPITVSDRAQPQRQLHVRGIGVFIEGKRHWVQLRRISPSGPLSVHKVNK